VAVLVGAQGRLGTHEVAHIQYKPESGSPVLALPQTGATLAKVSSGFCFP